MQLTLNTDYSLRVLLYVAERPEELISTKDISEYFKISQNHLVKVVNNLGKLNYLNLKRGRPVFENSTRYSAIVAWQLINHHLK